MGNREHWQNLTAFGMFCWLRRFFQRAKSILLSSQLAWMTGIKWMYLGGKKREEEEKSCSV